MFGRKNGAEGPAMPAKEDFARRIRERDPTLFMREASRRAQILGRLGWLDAPRNLLQQADEISRFAAEIAGEGVENVVILGMGGSSLCPLVLSMIFPRRDGCPALAVADTTSPEAVGGLLERLDPGRTLYLVSSKSGTTVEPLSLYRIFREACATRTGEPGMRFAAITDPGTPLAEMAEREGFRRTFLAPADVGGRYSALTVFGMVPAALMGIDIRRLAGKALEMAGRCASPGGSGNPGVELGAWIARQAREGRDKLILRISPSLAPFGLWLEQLLAESTGKEGKGVLPVVVEPSLEEAERGSDRACASIRLFSEESPAVAPGTPHCPIVLESLHDLGGEFFRWEMATAALGFFMGINPFDEPNVAESKQNTQEILEEFVARGTFPQGAFVEDAGAALFPPQGMAAGKEDAARKIVGRFLRLGGRGDYLAILCYLPQGDRVDAALARLRAFASRSTGLASTCGYGPRYLHSTGQFHKGGPPKGLFLIFTAPGEPKIPIPGERYDLGELRMAQALGDELALRRRGRPVLRIHLHRGAEGFEDFVDRVTRS